MNAKDTEEITSLVLPDSSVRGLFVAMNGAVTPDELDRFADRLEENARALRTTANTLRGTVSIQEVTGTPSFVRNPPRVLEMAEKAMRQAGRPLHVTEILSAVRAGGASVND
jgi:hypothetical protein